MIIKMKGYEKMKTVKEDNKILQELDFFLQEDLELYFSFKKSIAAAYSMKLTIEAEQDFLQHKTENYLLYAPRPEFGETFIKYCHLADTPDTPYLFIRRDGRLVSIFCLNRDGIVTQRKHIYSLPEMADIYYSFENTLRQYRPTRNLLQPTLAVAKEAVAV